MTDQVQDLQATETQVEQPAAEPKSVTTEAQTDGAQGENTSPDTQDEVKSFSQEEVDEIIRKRVAKAEARAERRVLRQLEKLAPQTQQQPQTSQPADDGKPSRSQYANEEAFIDALTDWKLEQRDRQVQAQRQAQQSREMVDRTERLYAEAAKVDGFDREDFDALPLTPSIVQAMLDSDVAPRLMAHMAAHPEEVERISKLPPARQAAEVGKLEDRIAATKPAKPSNAPRPIAPVGSRGAAPTTDPAKMSVEEYAANVKAKGSFFWARSS